ncbi:MAG: RDD family protein [Pseudonocardiales bacterium]
MTQPYDPLQKQPQPGSYPAPPPAPPQGGYPAPTGQGGYAPAGYPAAPGTTFPQGTELATAGKRIGTYLVDVVLLVVTLFIGYLIWSLIVWSKGLTPGKQVMGLRTYHLQSQRAATWGQMFLRQVVGGIVNGILYIGFIVSVVFLFTDPTRRTVPDRIAGTVILSDPNKVLEPR